MKSGEKSEKSKNLPISSFPKWSIMLALVSAIAFLPTFLSAFFYATLALAFLALFLSISAYRARLSESESEKKNFKKLILASLFFSLTVTLLESLWLVYVLMIKK